MIAVPFFTVAMLSPTRQTAFRRAVVAHLTLLGGLSAVLLHERNPSLVPFLGHAALVAGIVEGAVMIGWRLTQIPKSQALEFLLVSPVQPRRLFSSESAVGLARFLLVQLSGLPILVGLMVTGQLLMTDLIGLMVTPMAWGLLTGIALAAWAYEPLRVRRIGEGVTFLLILVYLVIGVLAGERLQLWLIQLPDGPSRIMLQFIRMIHVYNPFSALEHLLSPTRFEDEGLARVAVANGLALACVITLWLRASFRLKGHFHDRHYKPARERQKDEVGRIGDRPLSWWAVRRVMEYSGRVNIWLAGGFGLLYAAYLVAGDHWPVWMGRMVFTLVEQAGGVAAMATALVVLAAVPAAFQYGLWDASAQDRCRRLELLLLTDLDGSDFQAAAAAAAWRRGRGYFAIALVLWMAAWFAGRASALQIGASISASVLLWGLSFAIGFRAFSRGAQANGLGTLLTIGMPLLAGALSWPAPAMAALVPPGAVYQSLTREPSLIWLPGPVAFAGLALYFSTRARVGCVSDLRQWYDENHGRKLLS
jgi:hypothetical protein